MLDREGKRGGVKTASFHCLMQMLVVATKEELLAMGVDLRASIHRPVFPPLPSDAVVAFTLSEAQIYQAHQARKIEENVTFLQQVHKLDPTALGFDPATLTVLPDSQTAALISDADTVARGRQVLAGETPAMVNYPLEGGGRRRSRRQRR